ncbi:MAG: TlpA disulfide reductase family protein [Cyclobacteriaceae bacterium]
MKSSLLAFFLILTTVTFTHAQEIEVIKFDDLHRLISQQKNGYSVINFWATWCKPCIAELPYFEKLNDQSDSETTVYLISFDFVEELETKVTGFVKKKGLKSEIKLLDETDYNSFIDKVSEEWSGAIPATLFVNHESGKRQFFEGEFEEDELFEAWEDFR